MHLSSLFLAAITMALAGSTAAGQKGAAPVANAAATVTTVERPEWASPQRLRGLVTPSKEVVLKAPMDNILEKVPKKLEKY